MKTRDPRQEQDEQALRTADYLIYVYVDAPIGNGSKRESIVFINNSQQFIHSLLVSSVMSDGLDSSAGSHTLKNIASHRYLEIANGEYPRAYDISYDIIVSHLHSEVRFQIDIPRELPETCHAASLPLLNRPGYLFQPNETPKVTVIRPIPFEDEADRIAYAEKKAREKIASLPRDQVDKVGEANLMSDFVHEILLTLPDAPGT